jgi:hypothetical protein
MAIAISLFVVTAWNRISEYLDEIPVDLPKVSSETPLYVFPSEEFFPSERYPKIIQHRDMTLYDLGGYVDTCGYTEEMEKQCQAKRDWARLFILEHWSAKKRGYISVGYPCTDCGPTDHFFIEPGENGDWHIVIRFETNDGIHRLPTAFSVKFRRPTQEERKRKSSTRVLSLLDKSGNEIRSF